MQVILTYEEYRQLINVKKAFAPVETFLATMAEIRKQGKAMVVPDGYSLINDREMQAAIDQAHMQLGQLKQTLGAI